MTTSTTHRRTGHPGVDDVGVVLVSYRSRDHVAALLEQWPADLPVVVVDNAADSDRLSELAARHPNLRRIDGGGQGFARAANLGAYELARDIVVFVNPDSRPTTAHLERLAAGLRGDPTAAAHAATMVAGGEVEIGVGGWEPTLRRSLIHAVGLHKRFPRAGLYAQPALGEQLEVDWTTGACMAVRRPVFLELGGFDEAFFVYSEDAAFGRRARLAGLRSVLRSDVVVPHGAGSSGAPSLEMMRLRGASFANYVHRYHPTRAALPMRGLVIAGSLLRAVQQAIRGDTDRSRQFCAVALGALSRRAFVGGSEVARARFDETARRGLDETHGSTRCTHGSTR